MSKFESSPNFYREEQQEMVDKAYARAQAIALQNEIRPLDFISLYTEDGVQADLNYVSRLENQMERDNTPEDRERLRLSTILECLLFEQGEQSEWFGPTASTIKTSRFDDIANGVDMLVEFEETPARLTHSAFAMDVTFSTAAGAKFDKIKNRLKTGELASIKYFCSAKSPFRGELSRIPLTVASAHPKTIYELTELWLEKDYTALSSHWIQFQILEELIEQGKIFAAYAARQKQPQAAASYAHVAALAEEIIKDKRGKVTDTGHRDDNFYPTLSNIKRVFES